MKLYPWLLRKVQTVKKWQQIHNFTTCLGVKIEVPQLQQTWILIMNIQLFLVAMVGHRQHTSEDGQNWGSGISSLTPKPETLSKLFNQGVAI